MPAEGYTKREAIRDIARGLDRGKVKALKRFDSNITLMGGVSARPGERGVLWVDLDPGTYWAADVSRRNPNIGHFGSVHVAGVPKAGGLPQADTVRAVKRADWAKAPRAIDHRGLLKFVNNSRTNHSSSW